MPIQNEDEPPNPVRAGISEKEKNSMAVLILRCFKTSRIKGFWL
jgi:hypothetical protein